MSDSMKKMLKILKKVGKITNSDYSGRYIVCLENALEDLLYEYEILEEKIKDLEQDLEDNYRPISYAKQVGICDKDFY